MITQARLMELLYYNPETGEFVWVKSTARWAGKRAGHDIVRGYRQIKIDGKQYLEHRLAWLYMTGEWPEHCVDHIDGNTPNNRWDNLRKATISQNCGNSKMATTNTSGHKNVFWEGRSWKVKVAGHQWYFKELRDAVAWAHRMREHYFGEFANNGDTK